MSIEEGHLHAATSSRPSRLGKASLILGIVSPVVMLLCGCVFPVGVLLLGQFGDRGDSMIDNALGPVVLLTFLASPLASLMGLGLGVAGLFKSNCRGKSALGILLNLITLSVFILLCLWWSAAIDDMIAC